jgi:predicted XRE-type DNA-binding protein
MSYNIHRRAVLPSEQVLHSCDTPCCVNPDHLFVGDNTANHLDKFNKGRQAKGESHGRAEINNALVQTLRTAAGTQDEIARRFGVSQSTVSRVKAKRTWKHL